MYYIILLLYNVYAQRISADNLVCRPHKEIRRNNDEKTILDWLSCVVCDNGDVCGIGGLPR